MGRFTAANYRAVGAEAIATALFVWAGCGSGIATSNWTAADTHAAMLNSIALGFGFSIAVLVYAIAHISGGHINPIVTFAFMLEKEMSIPLGLLYMFAQFFGAWIGALLLWGCVASLTHQCDDEGADFISSVCASSEKSGGGYGPPFGLAANKVESKVSIGSAFLLETMGSYLLVFVVLHTAYDKNSVAKNAAPIAIGWAVLLAHLVLVPFTGCGINPARTFGPFVVDSMGGLNYWVRGWWIFFTAPFFGSLCAWATFKFILCDREEKSETPVKSVSGHEEGIEVTETQPAVPETFHEEM
eukprot:scaffold55164_cov65-Attheya_sp.AAC.2